MLVGVVCALLQFEQYLAALIVFIVAASTDWVDGYWARRFDQVTKLGRVFDPFADKMIIGSVFIYLSSIPHLGIPAWATVIVVGRELLVTALRSAVEAAGGDFSAGWSGKWKMVAQCITAGASMLALHQNGEVTWVVTTMWVSLTAAIVLTIHSAVGYVRTAFKFLGIADTPAGDAIQDNAGHDDAVDSGDAAENSGE
jgi:CDP-diacylglycerol--glycerol-3-phosphate 3-phosphatidyltransferase